MAKHLLASRVSHQSTYMHLWFNRIWACRISRVMLLMLLLGVRSHLLNVMIGIRVLRKRLLIMSVNYLLWSSMIHWDSIVSSTLRSSRHCLNHYELWLANLVVSILSLGRLVMLSHLMLMRSSLLILSSVGSHTFLRWVAHELILRVRMATFICLGSSSNRFAYHHMAAAISLADIISLERAIWNGPAVWTIYTNNYKLVKK